MTDLAVIRATFCDFRIVKGRKQAQLIFEVPLEQAQEAITRLGMPMPSNPVWCAIAKLDPAKATEPPKAEANAKSEKAKEVYRLMPEWKKAATRAVLLCKDPRFWEYIDSKSPDDWCNSEEKAVHALKMALNIKSRKDIATEERAFREFIALETEYRKATGQLAEVRG